MSSEQQRQSKTGVETVRTIAGDGNPKSKASRKRHNRRQQELYQNDKKAKRAQLAKQAVEVAPGAPLVPSEPMEQVEANGGSEVSVVQWPKELRFERQGLFRCDPQILVR